MSHLSQVGLIALFLATARHPWAGDAGTLLPGVLRDGEEEGDTGEEDDWQAEIEDDDMLSRDELVDAGELWCRGHL